MEIKEGYKQTEVGMIPADWRFDFLKNVTYLIIDGTHHTPKYQKYGIPFLRVTDIQSFEIDFNELKYVSEKEHSKLIMRCNPQKGDLLLSKNGTIGIPKIIDWDWEFSIFVSLALLKIRPEKLNVKFLEQFIISTYFKEQLAKNSKQGTVINLHLEEIEKLIIPLPLPSEQQAIAEVLTDTDNLIQALEKQIAKKKLIKQGVMQQLLTPKEGWEVKRLGEIFDFYGGYSASREQLSNEGYCYLHYGDIHGSTKTYIDCSTDFLNIPKLNIKLNKISKKSLLRNGDVVFVDASEDDEGTSRHIVIRNGCNIPFISGLHTIVARSKDESIDLKFKSYCFQSKFIKDQFKFYAVGTKVSGVSKTSIKNVNIQIPPLIEQKSIANTIEAIDFELEKLIEKQSKYKSIKQGLMQQLLTGKIRLIES